MLTNRDSRNSEESMTEYAVVNPATGETVKSYQTLS